MSFAKEFHACPDWRERVVLYASGGISLAELAGLRAHLDYCSACQGYLEQLELQVKVLRSLPRSEAPAELDARVSEEIRAPDRLIDRFLKRIGRVPAPPALWARVREEMALRAQEESSSRKILRWTHWTGIAAAGIALAVGGFYFVGSERPPRHLPLFVIEIRDPSALSSSPLIEGSFGYLEKR